MKDKSRTKTINKSSNGKAHHAIRASADSFLSKILALIGPILAILAGGGSFADIIAKILELFFPPQPAPGAMAAASAP